MKVKRAGMATKLLVLVLLAALAVALLSTSNGAMVVTGENLHIEKLSLDGGDLKVEGDIDSVSYEDDGPAARGGFLSRLLR